MNVTCQCPHPKTPNLIGNPPYQSSGNPKVKSLQAGQVEISS